MLSKILLMVIRKRLKLRYLHPESSIQSLASIFIIPFRVLRTREWAFRGDLVGSLCAPDIIVAVHNRNRAACARHNSSRRNIRRNIFP